MNPSAMDWRGGKVTYWRLNALDERAELAQQMDNLQEDLAQVEFHNGALLDVGWYPARQQDGAFQVTVVLGSDWDRPIFKQRVTSFRELRTALMTAIDVACSAQSRGH